MASVEETDRAAKRQSASARLVARAMVAGALLSGFNAFLQVCRTLLAALHGLW